MPVELNSYNNGKMRAGSKIHKEMLEYTLSDYEFLEDYEIIDSHRTSKTTFLAQIKNTTQKVRFIKKRFTEQLFPRFKVLSKLYKNGIVLADNMFIIQQCEQHYFYVIEAELEVANRRFRSLHHFLYEQNPTEDERRAIVSKIKILVDCLHQQGQAYAGLDVRNIIVDDENHIYLAPFSLESELRTDDFSRAYYPPQILAKIETGSSQIDEASMVRWDFWSFGCITAEVLLYSSPLFLETSLLRQIRRIRQFAFVDQLANLEESMKNVIANSLSKDAGTRSISATQITITKNADNENDLKKTVKNWKKKCDPTSSEDIAELNINKDAQTGDSELTIHFITLQAISFKDELHVMVELNKKYHFYVDCITDTTKYKLNKTITIKNSFGQLAKLLEEPVKVQVRQGGCKSTFYVNLQSLVMVHEGRRLWNKQLLGTYKADKDSNFSQAKLKVSCVLNSPEFFVEQSPAIPQKIQEIQLPKDINLPPPSALAEMTNTVKVTKKKKQKTSSRCDIPSISEISKSISSITEHFIKKLSCSSESPKTSENPLKQKIERALDLC